MRRRGRTDANQKAIVAALRQIGATVAVTSDVGGGFPDLVVGYRGDNILLECKDGDKKPSAQALTEDQLGFKELWRGTVYVATSPDHAIALIHASAKVR